MKTRLSWGLCMALGLAASPSAWAQMARADSSLAASAARTLSQRYTQAVGSESRLYNGPEYVSYVRRDTKGSRFFGSDEPQPGTVLYAGHTYAGVPLRYDLVKGLLVLPAQLGALEMSLVNEQVAQFSLGGHTFIRLVADSSSRAVKNQVPTGFYDLLVEGPVRLLAARRKHLEELSSPDGIKSDIYEKTTYFLYANQQYYSISKGSTLLRLFPQQKAALRRYSSDNKLTFKGDSREQALVALVRYQATLPAAPAN